MASRNERKRRAKVRHSELQLAVKACFDKESAEKRAFDEARDAYCAKIGDALRHHRTPSDRAGKVVKVGHKVAFQATSAPPPVKRKLSLNPVTGKMIEKRKTYI